MKLHRNDVCACVFAGRQALSGLQGFTTLTSSVLFWLFLHLKWVNTSEDQLWAAKLIQHQDRSHQANLPLTAIDGLKTYAAGTSKGVTFHSSKFTLLLPLASILRGPTTSQIFKFHYERKRDDSQSFLLIWRLAEAERQTSEIVMYKCRSWVFIFSDS